MKKRIIRKKIINVGGKSLGTRYNVNELEAYDLKEGDIIETYKVEEKQDDIR